MFIGDCVLRYRYAYMHLRYMEKPQIMDTLGPTNFNTILLTEVVLFKR